MKNALKRLLGNKGVVTIAAGILCLVILIFAYNYRVNKKINPVEIPYAKEELRARTKITKDKIGIVKVASSMLSTDVIRSESFLIDKYVNYNTYIPAGSVFYKSSIVTWDRMPDSAWSNIENNNTIFSLSVNDQTTYGNSIFPGDKIDLYYHSYDDGQLVYGKLIEGIEILAVKDSKGNHIFKKSSEQQNAAALIFSVPEELHLLLRKAIAISGNASIVPIPRNKNYVPNTTISSQYLKELILSQTREVPLDFIEEENESNGEIIVSE